MQLLNYKDATQSKMSGLIRTLEDDEPKQEHSGTRHEDILNTWITFYGDPVLACMRWYTSGVCSPLSVCLWHHCPDKTSKKRNQRNQIKICCKHCGRVVYVRERAGCFHFNVASLHLGVLGTGPTCIFECCWFDYQTCTTNLKGNK